MVLKFREERISELENKLAKMKDTQDSGASEEAKPTECKGDCEECKSLKVQLANAKKEAEEWKATHERNPPAAKLFAEKAELEKRLKALQDELKVTPESLTARVRGLNDMTNDLNSYLKQYCMDSQKNLKEELENAKSELGSKVTSLEAEMALRETQHAERIKIMTSEHEAWLKDLKDKMETMKANLASERAKLEESTQEQINQIKKDLETREGQTLSVEEEFQ